MFGEIGGRATAKLAAAEIGTITDIVKHDPQAVRDLLTVTGARVHAEPHGVS